MEKKNIFENILIISIVAILYIIPVSTIEGDNYNIFYYTRLIFIVFFLFLFLKRLKIRTHYLVFVAVFLFRFVIYKEVSFNLILLTSCIYIFDYLLEKDINYDKINKIINIASLVFLVQIIITMIYNKKIQTTSLIGDNNYTGYFIFFLFIYFFYTKKKIWILWFTLAMFTFSRATIIAVCIVLILGIIEKSKKIVIKKETSVKIVGTLVILGQIIIIPISYMFVQKFNNYDYTYTYVQGFQRLSNLMDNSNYFRFMVNILAIKSFSPLNLLIGLKENTFEGINFVKGKTLFPHNTMLGLYIHFGMVVSFIYILKYIKLYKKCNNVSTIPIYLALITYQIFLGPSSFYGIELLVFMLVIKGIDKYLEKKENK